MTFVNVATEPAAAQTIHRAAARPEALELVWGDGLESRFPAVWLRDNLPEERARAGVQKKSDIALFDGEPALERAELADDGRVEVSFRGEDLTVVYDPAWLRAHCLEEAEARRIKPSLWRAGHAVKRQTWPVLLKDAVALKNWLTALRDDGVVFLRDLPAKHGAVLDVVALFGFVRETNYGRLFDVVTEETPANLANSAVGLGLHTDNPYRDPVPQLQLLHCLEASAEGGESVVVDGFAVAEALREEAPDDFELLRRHAIPFAYAAPGVHLSSRGPVIETDDRGEVAGVRYNNRSAAPFDLPGGVIEDYYRAYRRFGRMLQTDARFQVSFRLGPGDLFIVDNRRVLHGRKGFAGGRRLLQGCYADRDGLRSTIEVLEEESA